MAHSDGDAGEPVGSERADDSVASSAADPQLRTFLIADIRGYTRFTQTRGDEAAAMHAAKRSLRMMPPAHGRLNNPT